MKNHRRIGIFLALLSGGILIFVNQNSIVQTFKSSYIPPNSIKKEPATTGSEFTGEKIRTFTSNNFASKPDLIPSRFVVQESFETLQCDKWGVMTTITSPPSEAVRRFLYMRDWCVVVVGDYNKPKDFTFESMLGENIIFLSSDDQKELGIDFVDSLPWNSFARKNVGYLFAIARGAKVIWDFDDDNFLKFWIDGAAIDKSLDINFFANTSSEYSFDVSEPEIENPNSDVFNPYPLLGSPSPIAWPRGLPLNEINNNSWNTTAIQIGQISQKSFAVLQSLADYQPDVDAIFRMTQKTPFVFERPSKDSKQGVVLRIPNNLLVPYNAQATLHFYEAFWALLLPASVPGRVSDIWRSYMGQALFKNLNLSVGFLPRPLVVQERNEHSNGADFIAEIPLYVQCKALVQHIAAEYLQRQKIIINLPEAIEQLWIDLYERGFIDISDVYLVQNWIKALKSINYKFPGNDQSKNPVSSRLLKIGKSLKEASLMMTKNMTTEPYKCNNKNASLIFANSDIHSGPRIDLPTILTQLGQKVILMGTKGHETNYPDVFRNNSNVRFYYNVSQTLGAYRDHSYRLSRLGIQKHLTYFQNDEVIKIINAFICTFPASMCELWMPFNKSIIFLPAHRYNLGRCSVKDWQKLNYEITIMASSNKHVVGAVSRYDAEYLRYYTGIPINIVTSFSGYYTAGNSYSPTKSEFLIVTVREGAKDFVRNVISNLSPEIEAVHVYDFYNQYTLKDLISHQAIIMLPYSVMSYKFTEFYSMNIPLFIPSPRFYFNYFDPDSKFHGIGHDRTSTSEPYCTLYRNLEKTMRPTLESGFSSHPYSPNTEFIDDPESELYWLQFADYYDWPHIQLYHNFKHLKFLLKTVNLNDISLKMKEENTIRYNQVNKKWCNIIDKLSKAQP